MDNVSWGIIGCGNVTEKKSGPAFNRIDNSKLVAVMRRDADKAKDYAKRHNVPKWYSNADDLIHDPDINAIYVATPPDSHAEYSIKALEAGKAVYCEKPMALNYHEAVQMLEASQKFKKPLFVAFYRRKLPQFMLVKELLNKQSIGEIRNVRVQLFREPRENEFNRNLLPWHVIPEIGGGGHFADMSPHQWDILDYWFGPIKTVKSIVKNNGGLYPAEDHVSALFEFESGIIGSGEWDFTIDKSSSADSIEISGTKGSIMLSCFEYMPVKLINSRGISEFPYELPVNIQEPFISSIVDELLGRGKSASDVDAAVRVNWIMGEVLHDYYHK